MATTKKDLKKTLYQYMIDNDLGFVSIEASMSMNKSKVIVALTEEEDDINDRFYLN